MSDEKKTKKKGGKKKGKAERFDPMKTVDAAFDEHVARVAEAKAEVQTPPAYEPIVEVGAELMALPTLLYGTWADKPVDGSAELPIKIHDMGGGEVFVSVLRVPFIGEPFGTRGILERDEILALNEFCKRNKIKLQAEWFLACLP